MIQRAFGMREVLRFRDDVQMQLALASVVYFYGGWPFLRGIVSELRRRRAEPVNDSETVGFGI